jgi:ribosomal protein S18 acetylase RimI-like enzyme
MNEQNVISILCDSFDSNLSTNYAIIKDERRKLRLMNLIRYSLEVSKRKGEVLLNESETSAALFTYSSRKIKLITQTCLDLKLIFNSIGFSGIRKVLAREKYIKSHHPKTDYIYLWFIGTYSSKQGNGFGSKLLNEIIARSSQLKMPIYLETSMPENIPFYTKKGFKIYHEKIIHDSGFVTYFIKRENDK